jgi:hypothetical protein
MNHFRKFSPIAIFIAVVAVILHTAFATVLYFAPVELWVEYLMITPAEQTNFLGKRIPMFTYLDVHYAVDVQYNDILRCKTGADVEGGNAVWRWKGSQSTKHLLLEPSDGPYYGPWDFEKKNIDLDYPDECIVESTITVTVWPGVQKQVKHYTEPFYIVEPES